MGDVQGNKGAGTIGAPAEPGDAVSIAGFPGKVDYLHLGSSNSGDSCAISGGHEGDVSSRRSMRGS